MDIIAERQAREAALKKEHSAYLEDHPEVKRLLNDFISASLIEQPPDVFHFAREYFKGTAKKVDEAIDDVGEVAPDQDDMDDLDDMLVESGGSAELTAYLKQVFEAVDVDGSGTITKTEMQSKLEQDTELQGLIEAAGLNPQHFVHEQLDLDGDGEITWQEFESMLGS